MDGSFKALCERLEHFETDPWAPAALLKKEILTPVVVDAGCGTGILSDAVKRAGHSKVFSFDVHPWGYAPTVLGDWLDLPSNHREWFSGGDFTVVMNPPFSKAVQFVDAALEYGARKVVCFQRFAWREGSREKGKKRGAWWEKNPPARIYLCADRVNCWRHDIPHGERKMGGDGKKRGGTSTAHAFFVWERGQPGREQLGTIHKSEAA